MKGPGAIATIIFCGACLLTLLWIGFGVRDDLREDDAFHGIAAERVDLAEDPDEMVYIGVAGTWHSHGHILDGVRAAVEQVNAGGGLLGYQVVLDERDDNGTVSRAEAIAQEFATNPAIPFVIGHTDPRLNKVVAQNYEFYQVLTISPNASLAGTDNKAYSLFFTNGYSARQLAEAFLDLAEAREWKHIGLVYAESTAEQHNARVLESMAMARQVTVPLSFAYPGPQPGTLNRIKRWRREMDLDAIYLDVSPEYSAGLIKTMRMVGMDLPVVCAGDPPLELTDSNKSSFGPLYVLRPAIPDTWPEPLAQCSRSSQGLCSGESLLGYEAVMLLAKAATQAGTLVPEEVARTLHGLASGPSLTGVSTFNQYNQIVRIPPTYQPL